MGLKIDCKERTDATRVERGIDAGAKALLASAAAGIAVMYQCV